MPADSSETTWRRTLLGAEVTRVQWWSVPEKYSAPQLFDDLEKAHAYGYRPTVTALLTLRSPTGETLELEGGVSSADSIYRRSPRQDEGVLPEPEAVVVEVVRRRVPPYRLVQAPDTDRTTISNLFREVVFRVPDGGQFVLLPR